MFDYFKKINLDRIAIKLTDNYQQLSIWV